MDYLVKGWNQYSFIVSPDNLKHILNPYHIVIFNAYVPLDYTESGLEECITA